MEARWVRALAVAYPFVTGFAVLATGNHYVLDLFGGLAHARRVVRDRAGVRAPARTAGGSGASAAQALSSNPRRARTDCHKVVTKSKTR